MFDSGEDVLRIEIGVFLAVNVLDAVLSYEADLCLVREEHVFPVVEVVMLMLLRQKNIN